jgi:hypothetical protein
MFASAWLKVLFFLLGNAKNHLHNPEDRTRGSFHFPPKGPLGMGASTFVMLSLMSQVSRTGFY